jgi:phosphoenolpyruvate synthase/pyruvate phosphate dikinase
MATGFFMLYELSAHRTIDLKQLGGKGRGLQILLNNGFSIPDTYVFSPLNLNQEIIKELERLIIRYKKVVLRSSANCEDAMKSSFAGLFHSFFDIDSLDALMNSIDRSIAQLSTREVVEYAFKNNINPEKIKLFLIIQPQYKIEIGGVLFTTSPLGPTHDSLSINFTTS